MLHCFNILTSLHVHMYKADDDDDSGFDDCFVCGNVLLENVFIITERVKVVVRMVRDIAR